MIIGYERCSTEDQRLFSQTDSLKSAGCEKIFSDKVSGSTCDRPGLTKLKDQLRRGDILIIYSLCRLSRSLSDLILWTTFLEKEGVELKSLKENIDTSSTSGRLLFNLM